MKKNPWLRAAAIEWMHWTGRHKVRERLGQLRRIPRALHIEGTNICNARCVFCAYPLMQRPKVTMGMDMFRRVVDEYIRLGGAHVSLTPIVGDPFVDRHLYQRLDYLQAQDAIDSFYFFTNAILMYRPISLRLLRYEKKLKVCVSLGGLCRRTFKAMMGCDDFEKVVANLHDLIDCKRQTGCHLPVEIHLRCPTDDWRGPFWDQLQQWQTEALLTVVPLYGYDSWGGMLKPENLRRLGLQPSPKTHMRGPCELLYMKPVVLADGRVNACACRDVEGRLQIGDLRTEGLGQIWRGEALEQLIERHERGDFPEVCRQCTYYISVYDPLESRIYKPSLNWAKD